VDTNGTEVSTLDEVLPAQVHRLATQQPANDTASRLVLRRRERAAQTRDRKQKQDPVLRDLMTWRADHARSKRIPPHEVLQDHELGLIADRLPRTFDDLARIIGPQVARRLQPMIVPILERHTQGSTP
jgi:ribonuclease D